MNHLERREDGILCFHAKTSKEWRDWLTENHKKETAVWIIFYKKKSTTPSIVFKEALDEALCFGWIDSKPNKRDEDSYFQYFSARNPKSNWSRINKGHIERLMAEGRMQEQGLEMVRLAKETGTWDALNDVEDLVIPDDLEAEFKKYPKAKENFETFPRSIKRGILEWIFNAKRPPTREKRIKSTAEKAEENIRVIG